MGNMIDSVFHTDIRPIPETEPKFDPLYGFENGRRERVPPVTEQELLAAKVPKQYRDYCAHYYLKWLECRRRNFPYFNKCVALDHAHSQCEFDDYVLRMKEYERERRLLAREQKRMQKAGEIPVQG